MALSNRLRWKVLQRDSFKCQYCGRGAPDVELEVDHIQPRSSGGADTLENLQTACKGCNQSKRATVFPGMQPATGLAPLSLKGRWFFRLSEGGIMELQGIVEQDGSDFIEVRYVAPIGFEARTHIIARASLVPERWYFYQTEADLEHDWKYGGLERAWRRYYGVPA